MARSRPAQRPRGRALAGPSVAKARALGLPERHSVELWRCSDYLVRDLFEQADVMSEGDVDDGHGAATYYGTTSILLRVTRKLPKGSLSTSEVYRYLSLDPHARTRAVRIACREAQVRCKTQLRRVRAELAVRDAAEGVRFDVEVEAAVDARAVPKKRARTNR